MVKYAIMFEKLSIMVMLQICHGNLFETMYLKVSVKSYCCPAACHVLSRSIKE